MATPPQSAATADFLWLRSRFGATADLPALFGMFFCCCFLLRTYKYSLLIYVPNDLLPCSPSEGGLQVGTFPSEGMQNQETGTKEARPTTARYKGVRSRKWGKWVAEVRFPNSRQRLWLGSYPTPEMAARAYDAAVYCLRGPGAALNFPSHPPSIPSADKLSKYEIREAAARHAREGPQPQQAEEAGKRAADPGAGSSGLGATSGQPAEPSSSVPVFEDATASGGDCFEGFWHDGGGGIDDDDIYGLSPLWNFQ